MDDPTPARLLDREHRAATIGVVSVMTLIAFEGIAVATAMPVAARELLGLGVYSWAFTAFVVTSLVGMVVAGTRCDREGPGRAMTIGILLFAGGAVAAGLAPSMPVLVLGRGIQGLGGGAAIVAVYVLIARAYGEQVRPRAFSVLAAAWVLPAIVGPLVAGWLADHVSWRAVFLIVPVFVLPPALLLHGPLHRHRGGDPQAGGRPGRTLIAIIAAVGLALLQDGLLRRGWPGTAEAVVGIAVLVPAVRRLLPPGALRLARGLPTTVLMRGILAGAFFAAETFIPLALIEQRGVSTTAAGLVLTVAALGWAAGSYLQGRVPGDRDRAHLVRRGCVAITVSIATLPLALLAVLPPWTAALSWGLGALGMGMSFPSLSVQTLRLSAPEDQGVNSSALQLSDSVGSVVAVGTAGAIHGAAVAAGGAGASTYAAIWLLSAAITAAAAVAAGRMRP